MSEIIQKVETFIQRLNNAEYVIDQKANEIIYRTQHQGAVPPNDVSRETLADSLARSLSYYEHYRNDTEENRLICAKDCVFWINKAFASGVVKEGDGFVKKLEDCKAKNVKLEKDLQILSASYQKLSREHKEFLKRFPTPLKNNWKEEEEDE